MFSLRPVLASLVVSSLVVSGPLAATPVRAETVALTAPATPVTVSQAIDRHIPMGRWMLGLAIPGGGHFLLGEFGKGLWFLQASAIAAGVLGVVGFLTPYVLAAGNPVQALPHAVWQGIGLGTLGVVVGAEGMAVWSAIDAYHLEAGRHGYGQSPEPAIVPGVVSR